MIAIFDNLEYNTEEMGLLFRANVRIFKNVRSSDWLRYKDYPCEVYVSNRGRYCMVYYKTQDKPKMRKIGESEVKFLMQKYDYDKYCLLFGKPEEA